MKQFSIEGAIKFGWNITLKNTPFFIQILLIILVLNIISFSITKSLDESNQLINTLIKVFFWIIETIVGMGFIKVCLEFIRGQKTKVADLYKYYNNSSLLLNYIAGSFLSGIIILLGFLALIIPGIYISIRLQFVTYLIIDKGLGPIEAIKESWRMTKNQVWNLFLFGIILGLINLAGILALIFGLFWSIPTTALATAFVYKKLANS